MKFNERTIGRVRSWKSKHLKPAAQFLLKFGINAQLLTTFSLISGLTAVYFLFNNYYLFVLFAGLHLLFDSLDGLVAREAGETIFGKYFDFVTDNVVSILILIKLGWYLNDYFVYLVAILFFIGLLVHFWSRLEAPMLFIRTVAIIVLIVATFPNFPYQLFLLTLGYLVAGSTTVFSLAKQLQWLMKKRI